MSAPRHYVLFFATFFCAGAAAAQPGAGTLFPKPFVVEHRMVQTDPGGGVFAAEPVTDTYGGSWIVSERVDGSRMVVDLARRELTEVRPERGTYWTLAFGRLAELAERVVRAELGESASEILARARGEQEPELAVSEPADPTPRARSAAEGLGADLWARTSVRHLRVERSAARASDPALDVWLDPRVQLTPAAIQALAAFEESLSRGAPLGRREIPMGRALDAARKHAAGAFAVRTVRPLPLPPGAADGDKPAPRGTLEDVATRLELIDAFPVDLVKIPDGLKRVPHPMEAVVAFLENDMARKIPGAPQED